MRCLSGLALASCMLAAQAAHETSLVTGAAPSRVVSTLGRDTPLVANKYDATSANFTPDPTLAVLGRRIFFDPALSEPRGTSCASCHDPAHAFAAPPQTSGPGTPRGSRAGHFSSRTAPSLLYVRYIPRRHFYQDDDATQPGPFGGLMADGRFDSIAAQIRGPLFDADEMNNGSPKRLLRKVKQLPLGQALSAQFGAEVLRDPERLLQAFGKSMQAFLQSDEMAPFSSRFDEYLRSRKGLTDAELRGLALFKNPDKGNCASCHALVDHATRSDRSLFTDFGYDAIAVPRNDKLPANRDPKHFDVGLCETARKLDWPEPDQWCGYLRTPGLRNVAVKTRFMHNGVFFSLRDAVAFYNTRSIDPAHWYAQGKIFDDIPEIWRDNINVNSTPMNRRSGMPAALSENEIDDITAFLRSLTDEAYVSARR